MWDPEGNVPEWRYQWRAMEQVRRITAFVMTMINVVVSLCRLHTPCA